MGPRFFIVLGSVCLVLQGARSCTPQRGGVRGGAGLPGTMRASSPTGVCYRTGFAVSRLVAGPPLVRRGGIYPSRGCSRRRGVRRDEGIPPYGRFIGFAYTGKAACFRREERHVGADSISARGVCGGAGRADMESAPTGVCYSAEVAVSRLGAGPPLVVGGGIYPSRGRSRRRGVRRDEGIPPYGRFIGSAYTGKAACFRRGVRGFPVGRGPAANLIPNSSFLIPHYCFVLFSASFARSRTQRVRSSGGRAAGRPHQRQTVASGGKCPRRA